MKITQLLLLAPLALAFPIAAHAQDSTDDEDTPKIGGQLQLTAVNPKAKVPPFSPLKHTDVQAKISGMMARVTVEQRFENPSRVPVEALYTFPLPDSAAVDAMEFRVGKRRIVGSIKRKEVARKIYEAAKSQGQRAALLDQERPNIFTQSVANIMPGDQIVVKISFVQTVPFRKGAYEWAFPTVVGPRYTTSGGYTTEGQRGAPSTPVAKSASGSFETDADKITPPIAPPGTRAGHDLSLHVDIDAGLPLGNIRSVLHPIALHRVSATQASINLQDQKTLPNKDFILRYAINGQQIQSGVLTHPDPKGKGGYFMMVVQPPHTPTQEQIVPRELVFVVDQTGSQSGWPIEKSKEAMRYALTRLRPSDTVQVLGFNTDVYPCFTKPMSPTADNLATAQKFVDGLQAGGGTDILKAITYSLKIPADPNRLRIVVYLTDGYVGNDFQIADFLHKNHGTTRVFPFGMGNSVNRYLIEAMAKEGRGTADYITVDPNGAYPKEKKNAEEAVSRFYTHIATPVLISPKVTFGKLPVSQVYPPVLNDVFDYGPIVVTGRYSRATRGFITLSGVSGTKQWTQRVPVNFGAKTQNPALESLWARSKVDTLMEQDYLGAQGGLGNPKIQHQIVQTALDHRLLTQWTSFVAVDNAVVNHTRRSRRADVPVHNPEGVDYSKATGLRNGISNNANRARVAQAPVVSSGGGGGFSAQPGDPLISVTAPADAQQVTAVLPDGRVLPLVFDALKGQWQANFDIPSVATDGQYIVTVIVARRDGTRLKIDLNYRVDTKAPNGTGMLVQDGQFVHLSVGASAGVARVTAITPWGERTDLTREEGRDFAAVVAIPDNWSSNEGAVTRFVLTDSAHNRTEIAVDWSANTTSANAATPAASNLSPAPVLP